MGGMNPQITDIQAAWDLSNELVETQCVAAWEAGQEAVYGKSGYTGYELQEFVDQDEPQSLNTVMQSLIVFPSAAQAQRSVSDQLQQWGQCANRVVTWHHEKASQQVTFGAPTTDPNGLHIISHQHQYAPQQHCEHALTARENVVVDVSACSVKPGTQAADMAVQLTSRIDHA